MLERKPIFPHVIEMNFQAGHLLGCNVYLIYDQNSWVLIDIGYDDRVEEIVELIRQMDFPLSQCQTLIATHADVDHIQGIAQAKQLLRTTVSAHPEAAELLGRGDKLQTFAEIDAQDIHEELPPVNAENLIDDGDIITIGNLKLEVWRTPGHTSNQLAFRMGNLLFSGDNIFRDGPVCLLEGQQVLLIGDFLHGVPIEQSLHCI